MDSLGRDTAREKHATVARVYDYLLGGIHNFPADQEVARGIIDQYPETPANARANRHALRRAVRHLTSAGVQQFLDIGSGIPTVGNVHEIAQQAAPQARVVYVDIDPVAVAESLEILDGNPYATAIRGDLRSPADILNQPALQQLLDLRQPTALLLAAVLHFIPGEQAYQLVTDLVDPLAPGSYLFISHATGETSQFDTGRSKPVVEDYQRQTASQLALRTRVEVTRFFTGLDLLEPGVVRLPEWRPNPDDPDPHAAQPDRSTGLVGLAIKPAAEPVRDPAAR